ncbi:MAG: hypothetical protein ABFC55_00945 [Tenuifilaceae bacterium]
MIRPVENGLLYKYRSLDNFKNFVDIIMKNRLFAAKYKDLNDPMEGQYYYQRGELSKSVRDKLIEEKGELRICSLSRVNNNELMWSHYTNGQRGVAIGVEIDRSTYSVRPIQYNGIASIRQQDFSEQTAMEILSHKLEVWNYEQEERAFIRDRHFIDVSVKTLITGRAMSSQDFGFIRELVSYINPNIEIIKAETIME